MKVYYCTNVYEGKVYDIYCEKFPDGRYDLTTNEAGKGQPLSDTLISFAQEMILTVQMEKNKIDELIKR